MVGDPDGPLERDITQEEVFEALFHRYHRGIYGFALRMLRSAAEAEEIVQETFIRVYASARTFIPGSEFAPWVYKIATNLCRNRLRHRSMKALVFDESIGLADPNAVSPLEIYETEIEREQVHQAVVTLPRKYREVVLLRYMGGLSYRQVADVLDVTVSAVETRLFRAKAILRKRLARFRPS